MALPYYQGPIIVHLLCSYVAAIGHFLITDTTCRNRGDTERYTCYLYTAAQQSACKEPIISFHNSDMMHFAGPWSWSEQDGVEELCCVCTV